jgi:hypothetical protein
MRSFHNFLDKIQEEEFICEVALAMVKEELDPEEFLIGYIHEHHPQLLYAEVGKLLTEAGWKDAVRGAAEQFFGAPQAKNWAGKMAQIPGRIGRWVQTQQAIGGVEIQRSLQNSLAYLKNLVAVLDHYAAEDEDAMSLKAAIQDAGRTLLALQDDAQAVEKNIHSGIIAQKGRGKGFGAEDFGEAPTKTPSSGSTWPSSAPASASAPMSIR